ERLKAALFIFGKRFKRFFDMIHFCENWEAATPARLNSILYRAAEYCFAESMFTGCLCSAKVLAANGTISGYTSSAGINRHVVGDERAEQPTRLRVWRGESPRAVNCLFRTASISEACGGNET